MSEQEPIAIVGIGGVFPGSASLDTFWQHVRDGHSVARPAPPGRWALAGEDAFDPKLAPDHVYSRHGCFVDPAQLHAPDLPAVDPRLLARLDPLFSLVLRAGRAAWQDTPSLGGADGQRMGVILGNIVLPTDASSAMAEALFDPLFEQQLFGRVISRPPVEPLNRYVAGLPAGLLARTLGLGGGSFTLDAACASSLYALKLAADELAAGRADAMLAGGVSRPDCLYTQMGFSQLRAISASGRCAPFDAEADGLVVGEGAGVVVLKRWDDARRHGDRIYAVIRGIGLSNDIGGNLMLPDTAGQLRAMRSAYEQASWDPHEIDLIECHGTGTPVGDAVEFQSLRDLWDGDGVREQPCVIGSVKSNVGHLLTGAGAAGLVKVLLAIQHGQLPPTANFRRPAAGMGLADSPFQILTEAQPWQRRRGEQPRRAAVSAFGFGGINAHVLLEEATAPRRTPKRGTSQRSTPPPPLDIAVVGLDACFGPWDSLEKFQHRALGAGESHEPRSPVNAWGSHFDPDIVAHNIEHVDVPLGRFRIPPAELKQMLPQQLLMLQVAANALADAGLADAAERDNLKLGVFVGIGLDLNTTNFHYRWVLLERARRWARELDLELNEAQLQAWVTQLRDAAGPPLTADRTMGALGGIVASRVARAFRAGGPSFTVSAEECSGLRALATAANSLQGGEIDTAICGGVDLACDPRALRAQHDGRPCSPDGRCQPFDRQGQGMVPADGASALVLKRAADARRSGDRIYAVIRGVGAASGGGGEQLVPTPDACHQAMQRACQQAQVRPETIGYIEGHGSGNPAEDECETNALVRLLGQRGSDQRSAIGSVKADIGHAGAAATMASLARTCLALHHRVLPGLRHTETLHPVLDPCRDHLEAPPASRYWLRDRARGPRLALVSGLGVDGNALSAVLKEAPTTSTPARPLGPLPQALFAVCADSPAQRSAAVGKLQDLAQKVDGAPIDHLARHWWQQHPAHRPAPDRCSIALLANSTAQLRRLAQQAEQIAMEPQGSSAEGIFYSSRPLGRDGQVAFVFPGSGNHFPGMGRELAAHFPEVLERQDLENEQLAAQFAGGRFWREPIATAPDMRDLIFAQVWLGAVVSDCVSQFGVRPQALIGYSLGETAAMFATRSWRDRDEMLRRMRESTLFTEDLAGPCHAARTVWQLGDDASVDWQAGVVDQPASVVREALRGRERIYLLIVNTPSACLIGGDRRAVERLVGDLRCAFHPVQGVTTVHCELARPVEEAYRQLHLLPTTPPPNARFYSGAWGRSYTMSRERIAESIVAQAIAPFDYTQVIETAWQDGVRLFLEMGPGASCCRMIDQILGDRPHLAQSACAPGRSETDQLLQLLAALTAEGLPIDLSPLYGDQAAPDGLSSAEPPPHIRVPVGGPALRVPPPPRTGKPEPTVAPAGQPISPPRPAPPSLTPASPASPAAPAGTVELVTRLQAAATAQVEAEVAFLKLSARNTQILGSALGAQASAVAPGPAAMVAPTPTRTPPVLDRDQCLEFGRGSIARVLGPRFAEVDQHPTRVRLPDEPLMLVDRILEIEGEPAALLGRDDAHGRVITEHDIHAGAWYLDGGRIPTCIAVEAGQADLFLSGYLGIDLITRGRAVYRLLDAQITFHRSLPPAGKTIRYDIRIDHFFRQGQTWLFRFCFEATVNGEALLSMTDGCAGFFTEEELAAGGGIVQTALQKRSLPGERPADWQPLVPMAIESFNEDQLESLRRGDLAACFGEAFGGLGLRRPAGLPGGRMTLVHRILRLEPEGGRFGLGEITGEADIHPNDWFLTCHFVDDRVMPGTLMYECCLHTLRVFLLRMGWVGEADEVVYEPVPGVASRLKCRGQVREQTQRVQYRLTLKQVGYEKDGTPFVRADALMSADGRPVVQMENMSVRLSGLNRDRLEALWNSRQPETTNGESEAVGSPIAALYDRASILAFSAGNPSEAFGEPYRVFDEQRVIARLPRPPYQFLDRIVSIQDCRAWELEAGGEIEAEYDVPADEWYFETGRNAFSQPMPFAVLLEVALQPCGWLAAYLGSALRSNVDLCFRNLGGKAVLYRQVMPDVGTLKTRVKITRVSESGGMIIQHFDFSVRDRDGIVYEGDTYFGFFTHAALANQVGIPGAAPYSPEPGETARATRLDYPTDPPFPDTMMRMIDRIDLFVPDGGPDRFGFVRGLSDVDDSRWFFKAHFYQDPVWPGSLGLESFLQLLKVAAAERFKSVDTTSPVGVLATGQEHEWIYRGQILPTDRLVTVQATITGADDPSRTLQADGFLSVDGRIIYQMNRFALALFTRP